MSAALVKSGKILPLEQRLPVASDVLIMIPYNEVGAYGGTLRTYSTGVLAPDSTGLQYGVNMSGDGLSLVPGIFKTFEPSADGRKITFQIRKGARWSDGYPHTMADVKFALDDMMLNKELMPGLPGDLKSPITGADFKVTYVDDTTFFITFDDPNYGITESSAMNIYSGIKGCPRCFIAPQHVYKRYHIKYNAAEIPSLLTKYKQPDWVRLVTTIRNVRGFVQVPSVPVPTVFDANFVYKGDHYIPWFGGWIVTSFTAEQSIQQRNHYAPMADPEGNQLPYIDEFISYRVESREVAMFRMMAGETDWTRSDMILSEMPLYIANMEKGDYSMFKHDSPDGSDSTYTNTQEYVVDPEIGALLRSKDFRIALSLAWDRNATNETVASGLGVPRNMVSHEKTPYFPGAEYSQLDIKYDLAKAKTLMAGLGYTDTDGNGFLDRKDGKGDLQMLFEDNATYFPYVQMLQSDWAKLGIKLAIKEGVTTGLNERAIPPTRYWNFFSSTEGGSNPWSSGNQRLAPIATHQGAPAIGTYYATRGEQGMAPTGGDAKYTDATGKMAPAGTYPADITGSLKKLQDTLTAGWTLSMLDAKRVQLGKDLFIINAQEKYQTGGLAFSGIFRALQQRRNNLRNLPLNWSPASGYYREQFAFEGGMDNVHNVGNRSKKYKSISFLDPGYWSQ
ncbi:MAG: hypothetical protein FJ319_09425 [SAR202 cluster bacterium]|nr:hypothetical protein [SAR202 cluster bacterium]